eukprot:jgi/Psemu1/1165/gm1.1165_g
MSLIATRHRAPGEECLSSSTLATDNPNTVSVVEGFEENKPTDANETDCSTRQSAPILAFGYEQILRELATTTDEKLASNCDNSRVPPASPKKEHGSSSTPDLLQHRSSKRDSDRTPRTIPSEIVCYESSDSSVHSDLESGSNLQPRRTTTKQPQHQETCDSHNKGICVELLESDWFDDNCIGMEHLVAIANRELVNSSCFLMLDDDERSGSLLLSSTLAYSLVCNTNDDCGGGFSPRLRSVFPTFFNVSRSGRTGKKQKDDETSQTGSESSSSSVSSPLWSSSLSRGSQDAKTQDFGLQNRATLKLPALRVLVSSLELVLRTRSIGVKPSDQPNVLASFSSFYSIDIVDHFWRAMLAYMTDCLQELVAERGIGRQHTSAEKKSRVAVAPMMNSDKDSDKDSDSSITVNGIAAPCSVEAALVVKVVRLLNRLEPRLMGPYLRYTLLPFVLSAQELGKQNRDARQSMRSPGDTMLVRECERLLKTL